MHPIWIVTYGIRAYYISFNYQGHCDSTKRYKKREICLLVCSRRCIPSCDRQTNFPSLSILLASFLQQSPQVAFLSVSHGRAMQILFGKLHFLIKNDLYKKTVFLLRSIYLFFIFYKLTSIHK